MNDQKRPYAIPFALIACALHLALSFLPLPSHLTVPIAALLPFALSRFFFGTLGVPKGKQGQIRLFLCFLPVLIACAMLLSLLAQGASEPIDMHPALLFLYAVLLPSVFEELFYRYTLLPLLLPVSRTVAVLASSLFFAALHAPSAMPYAFVCGILLAFAYIESGSIFLPIALHFGNNAVSFFFACVPHADVLYVPLLILLILCSIPAVYLYLRHKGILFTKGKNREKL